MNKFNSEPKEESSTPKITPPEVREQALDIVAYMFFLDSKEKVKYFNRKKMEEEILHAKEEAEHAREMEEHFLANASHEIRTPMNGIIGMTRQLLESKLNRHQVEITNTIIDSANNLLVIINDLLDLSKIKAGKMELEEVDFRLNDILKKLLELVKKDKETE